MSELLGDRPDAGFWNHHPTVGHRSPREVGKRKTLGEGGVKRDTGEQGGQDPLR